MKRLFGFVYLSMQFMVVPGAKPCDYIMDWVFLKSLIYNSLKKLLKNRVGLRRSNFRRLKVFYWEIKSIANDQEIKSISKWSGDQKYCKMIRRLVFFRGIKWWSECWKYFNLWKLLISWSMLWLPDFSGDQNYFEVFFKAMLANKLVKN